jgi:hypothetical protein
MIDTLKELVGAGLTDDHIYRVLRMKKFVIEDAVEILAENRKKQEERQKKKQENIKKHSKALPIKSQKKPRNDDPLDIEDKTHPKLENGEVMDKDSPFEKKFGPNKWNKVYPVSEYVS